LFSLNDITEVKMNIKEINAKKESIQLDLDNLDIGDTWLMQEVSIILEPGPGEKGGEEKHQGILLIKKN